MNGPILGTLILLAVAGTSAPIQADDEMIVTVRKAEENLQDVPLSITALPSVTLERGTVQQLSDVANLTPGLTFQDFNVGALSTPVIRGLAQSNTQGRENNVGMLRD
jgi:iron complex outermembrane receptor protein